MSGLIGLINFPSGQTDSIGKKLADQLCRFEWNTWDWWVSNDRTVALGRVDIGLFNPDPQPVSNSDGQVIVFFSGELYRTQELKRELEVHGSKFSRSDDPELVLNAYLLYGPGFISRLEGAFHLAILDQNNKELLLANDRFGLRPLYWTQYRGRFAFAPEVKALLVDTTFNKQLDLVAVAEYMRFQQLLGEKTFFQGVSLLPNTSMLRYQLVDGKISITPYWSCAELPKIEPQTPYREVVEEAARLFQRAIEMLGSGPHRIGLYLSGGLDSRLIAGSLSKMRPNFVTVSYGDKDSVDVLLAKRIAQVVGSEHHFFEFMNGLWVLEHIDLHLELTEGFHSWIHSHGISTLGRVRSLFEVNLTGWGVDTGLGGLFWDPIVAQAQDDWAFNSRLFFLYNQKLTWPGLTEDEEYGLYTDEYRSRIQGLAFESLCTEARKLCDYPFDRRAEFLLVLQHNRRLTQNYLIFNNSHLENRIPGYDYQLFDFVYSLPPSYGRPHRRLQQDAIEFIDPRLALIPQSKNGLLFTRRQSRRISHHIITRLKERTNKHIAPIFRQSNPLYADYGKWLRNELRDWAVNVLLDGRMASRGMFNADFASSLLERHFLGLEEKATLYTIGKIAPIMTFEMMLRKYFD